MSSSLRPEEMSKNIKIQHKLVICNQTRKKIWPQDKKKKTSKDGIQG
jgi:hypothetical protein